MLGKVKVILEGLENFLAVEIILAIINMTLEQAFSRSFWLISR